MRYLTKACVGSLTPGMTHHLYNCVEKESPRSPFRNGNKPTAEAGPRFLPPRRPSQNTNPSHFNRITRCAHSPQGKRFSKLLRTNNAFSRPHAILERWIRERFLRSSCDGCTSLQ